MVGQHRAIGGTRVLHAPVGVMQQPRLGSALVERHP